MFISTSPHNPLNSLPAFSKPYIADNLGQNTQYLRTSVISANGGLQFAYPDTCVTETPNPNASDAHLHKNSLPPSQVGTRNVDGMSTRWVCCGVYDSGEAGNIAVDRERASQTGLVRSNSVAVQKISADGQGHRIEKMYSQGQATPIVLLSGESGAHIAEYFNAKLPEQRQLPYISSEPAGPRGSLIIAGRTAFQQESLKGAFQTGVPTSVLHASAFVDSKRPLDMSHFRTSSAADGAPPSKRVSIL
jgi:hypothetical protein